MAELHKLSALAERRLVSSSRATGTKAWLFRYKVEGREREMGLGSFPHVSLADARDKAIDCRKQREAGVDPLEARKAEEARKKLEAARGALPVQAVDAPLVLKVLHPIWTKKPETASPCTRADRSRSGLGGGEQVPQRRKPRRLARQSQPGPAEAQQVQQIEHHAALPFDEIAAFIAGLRLKTQLET